MKTLLTFLAVVIIFVCIVVLVGPYVADVLGPLGGLIEFFASL